MSINIDINENSITINDGTHKLTWKCANTNDIVDNFKIYINKFYKDIYKNTHNVNKIAPTDKPKYIDFGKDISGYLYIGKDVNSHSSVIVVEEGSSMNVLKYGIGKQLMEGKLGIEDCIFWLHDRNSAIRPLDVIKSVNKIKEYLAPMVSIDNFYGIGFSNGAASLTSSCATQPNLFNAIVSIGGNTTGLSNTAASPKLLFFCNCAGAQKNLDTVGRFIAKGRANAQAYMTNISHTALEKKYMTADTVRYLCGDWKKGYDGDSLTADGRCNGKYYYNGVKVLK